MQHTSDASHHKRARAIMFQGTCSNAGKSVLTAGLCRILARRGVRVAPFKSQNMALNSFVTPDGGEIGRAQATQARACGLEPDVRMNPVLLKPSSDTGSQVVVLGQPVGNMSVREYVAYKKTLFTTIKETYDSLAAEYDVIVLEGAGSPAEINLKAHDVVNMNMARYADARVLLVGDIDRGGVFAALVGTMALLDDWEQELVEGFLINLFRGDPSLLDPAYVEISRRTGKPFLGTIPWLNGLNLPEEDSVNYKSGRVWSHDARPEPDQLDIALIDLAHISNFTDMDALAAEPDVCVRAVRTPAQLGTPDAIIIPGSKATVADLQGLQISGLDKAILAQAQAGVPVVGICGGFQIMGQSMADDTGVETSQQQADGLGLLDVATSFGREKVLTRISTTHTPSGQVVEGYEIHHGQTHIVGETGTTAIICQHEGRILGVQQGNHWGTYIHGIFDESPFRRWFVNNLRTAKGWTRGDDGTSQNDSIDAALDRLADHMEANMDMERILALVGVV